MRAILLVLVITLVPSNSQAQATQPSSQPETKARFIALPAAVRDEIDRLESNDEGKRATGAAALAEMGTAASPAIPWLFAAVDDLRPVMSLRYGRATVAFVAGRALAMIGPPAIDYVLKKLQDPTTALNERETALRAAAIMHAPEMLDPVLKLLDLECSPNGNLCSQFGDVLECFMPDPRVPEAMLRMAAELERRGDKSPGILISFTTLVRGHEDGKNDWIKTVSEAQEWWAANASSAKLRSYSEGWCAEVNSGH